MNDREEDLSIQLDQNLEALADNEWVELAVAYKAAFAGEPWFEVGACAAEVIPESSPCAVGKLSPLPPGSRCDHCHLDVREEAYPLPTLLPQLAASLRGRPDHVLTASEPDTPDVDELPDGSRARVLYRERSRSRGLLLGALFWKSTREELITKKYADKPAGVHELIRELTPDGPILYLDEIFADLSKRALGNLWNYAAMCQAAAIRTESDVLVFRTKNTQLRRKTQSVFPQAQAVLPTEEGFLDDRHYIVIRLDVPAPGREAHAAAPRRDLGFAEWLPGQRRSEQELTDRFGHTCELHGYAPIETPAIEPMSLLSASGGISRQIFTVGRPIEDQPAERTSLGLHFDLTVPLARYVAEHVSELQFPFRRYQCQKVWRGERDSPGRFREFYQFDFDIIGDGVLSRHHEVEILQIAYQLLASTGVAPLIRISDSEFLKEMLDGVQPSIRAGVLRIIAEESVAGPSHLRTQLERLDLAGAVVERLVAVCKSSESLDLADDLASHSDIAKESLKRLRTTLRNLEVVGVPADAVSVDLSLVRGLDYYTAFVFETVVPGEPMWGSVCSGGRYDNLLRSDQRSLPGVGASIGLTRLFTHLVESGYETARAQSPAPVTFVVSDWVREDRALTRAAAALREDDIGVEIIIEPEAGLSSTVESAGLRGARLVVYLEDEVQAVVVDLRTRAELKCLVSDMAEVVAARLATP
jgi:histidyl-tRNA synthetase